MYLHPLHQMFIGHLSEVLINDFIANVFTSLRLKTTRSNHLQPLHKMLVIHFTLSHVKTAHNKKLLCNARHIGLLQGLSYS